MITSLSPLLFMSMTAVSCPSRRQLAQLPILAVSSPLLWDQDTVTSTPPVGGGIGPLIEGRGSYHCWPVLWDQELSPPPPDWGGGPLI